MRHLLDLLLTPIGRWLGYGGCLCCHASFWTAKGHDTNYDSNRACFPLCEHCWHKLGTPQRRLPYYRQLVLEIWGDEDRARWVSIREAVLAGR